MAGEYVSSFDYGVSGATGTGSQRGSSIVKPPSADIDWKSIIGLLGNKPLQGMQVPFQSLLSQYPGTNAMSQTLPTPAMFPEEQQKQTSISDMVSLAELIMLFI